MTILTKTSDLQKEKLIGIPVNVSPSAPTCDGDVEARPIPVPQHRLPKNGAFSTFLILCLIACIAMIIGILGGMYYHENRLRSSRPYFRICQIPYNAQELNQDKMMLLRDENQMMENVFNHLNRFGSAFDNMEQSMEQGLKDFENVAFEERFEINQDEDYEKVGVPDYEHGRRGRFLHDFKANQSAIVDKEASRCFVLPLDREHVLPPKSLSDLLNKMYTGYYDIDTSVIKQRMRVITPALVDYTDISERIIKECKDMSIYKLEKIISGVYKRSIDLDTMVKYAQFAGKNVIEFDIVNIDDLEA